MKSTYDFDVLRGRTQELPDVRSKVVRVFVSSTFTGEKKCTTLLVLQLSTLSFADTLAERDSLIENIFPKLKEYCRQQYGLEFQVSDDCLLNERSELLCSSPDSMRICVGAFKRNQPIITAKWLRA